MNTKANNIHEFPEALVVDCAEKQLLVHHARRGDLRISVAALVDANKRTYIETAARIPAARVVDLCAALLGDDGDVFDWTDDGALFKLRVRIHHAPQGVFVGISRNWHGRIGAGAFQARTMYIPAEVAERVARYCAA